MAESNNKSVIASNRRRLHYTPEELFEKGEILNL
jgi:hypothetical protein